MVVLYILAQTVNLFLGLVYFAMAARAILSWFIPEDGSVFMGILVFITEIFISPVRFLLSRFRFVSECPIDISYMAAFFLLMIIRMALPIPTL